jgi:hypothetical protein
MIEQIDLMYSITTNTVNFSKFDTINSEKAKDIITNELEKQNLKEFNITTKLFFLCHVLLSYFVKSLDDEYAKVAEQLSTMYRSNMMNDPKL